MSDDDLPPVAVPDWRDLLAPLVADRRRVAGVVAAVLLLTGLGLAAYALLTPSGLPATELTLPMAGAAGSSTVPPASTTTAEPAEILVHAAGAVAVPGVHAVPAGSRVADLLAAAGGPAADADLDRVNLAAVLDDGERVWFPRVGEDVPPVVAASSTSSSGSEPSGPVDLNAATEEQLDALPGIGPAIAAAIVSYREEHGPFSSVDDLLDVPGIGDAKLAQLRELVTV